MMEYDDQDLTGEGVAVNIAWIIGAIVMLLITGIAGAGFAGGYHYRKHTAADRIQVATAQLQAAMAHNEEASAIAAEALVTAAAYEIKTNLRRIYRAEGKTRKEK